MKNASNLLLAAALLTTVSCGNKKSSSSASAPKQLPSDPITQTEGNYRATFAPINGEEVSGTATVVVKADTFKTKVMVNGTAGSMNHVQSIHMASECPTLASDTNNDGVIDAAEGKAVYGDMMVPLNYSFERGNTIYPMADFAGNYSFVKEVSLSSMIEKLKLDTASNFENKVVVIYGVDANTELPESVVAMDGLTKQASLPVACGSFVKIADEVEGTTPNGGKEEVTKTDGDKAE